METKAAKTRAVLFDFDGTLVDTTALILRCFHATWERYGVACEDAEYIRTFGIPLKQALEGMLRRFIAEGRVASHPDPAAHAEELAAAYRELNARWHDEMIRPFPGVDETLRALKSRGYLLGLVTSKKRVGAERGMRHYAMEPLFSATVCGEETANSKPHPEPVLAALAALGARPEEALFVGDSPHDIEAGKAAGVATAAATWGPFARGELARLAPDYLLDAPTDLLAICP
jgi:pyrophosphatase PpaX